MGLYRSIEGLASKRGHAYASVGYFCKLWGMDRKTVMKLTAELEDAGLIAVERRNGNANKYFIVPLEVEADEIRSQRLKSGLLTGEPVPHNGTGPVPHNGTGTSTALRYSKTSKRTRIVGSTSAASPRASAIEGTTAAAVCFICGQAPCINGPRCHLIT